MGSRLLITAIFVSLFASNRVLGQKQAVLFSILNDDTSHQVVIDPMFMVNGSKIIAIPDLCNDANPTSLAFESRYLSSGSKYQVLYGGAKAGDVTVLPMKEGLYEGYPAKLDTTAKLTGMDMALASDSMMYGRLVGFRRLPTESDMATIKATAQQIFSENGVAASAIKRMEVEHATISEFTKDEAPRLIATVTIQREDGLGLQESLFFVTPRDRKDNPELVVYQHPKSETEGQNVFFVDGVDIDHDGVDELVTRLVFYENYRYQVYKRTAGVWRKISETSTFGCL